MRILFQAQSLLIGSHLPLLVGLHDLGQVLIHEGHMDYCLGAGITENSEQHTFKAPCCCFENAPNID